jgi:cell division protein FtsI/penicillin-binding protein 2
MRRRDGLQSRSRILTLMVLMVMGYLVLFARLVYWQQVRHLDLSAMAAAYHDDRVVLPAARGKIVDRNGALLVTNTPVFSVFASPDQIDAAERGRVSAAMAPVLDMPAAEIMTKLQTNRMFVYIKRRVPAAVAHQLDGLGLTGIGKLEETQRTYVAGPVKGTSLAANLLGFTTDDGQGSYGVEGYYDKELAGQDGFEATIRDLQNNPIVLSDRERQNPVDGATLQLSLESSIQVVAERALADGVRRYKAESGTLIIMEPSTGRIVAWADVPSYDANKFPSTPTSVFRDAAVSDLYEPGSVMKVVTLSGALDNHTITPQTRIDDTGVVRLGGYSIHNWDGKAHGSVTMSQVLANSLNVGAIKAEQMEGSAAFFNGLQKFRIGTPTGIDVAGEVSAPLGNLNGWADSRLATASFGQGIAATPIQVLAAVNAVATGGEYVWPHVVDNIIDAQGRIHPVAPRVLGRAISPEAAAQMRDMMIGAVEHGSGYAARIDGFRGRIAGKTGTASIPVAGGYSRKPSDVIGSFVGFLPANNPQFTMLVIVRKPNVLFEGAYVAAPIWKTVASAIIAQWNIAP